MSTRRTQRQLAAIISVDVVGFSRLMGADEDGTLATLKRLQKTIVSPQVMRHQGRIAKLMGDGAISYFPVLLMQWVLPLLFRNRCAVLMRISRPKRRLPCASGSI